MGSLDIESDQTPPVLEPEHETESIESESVVDSPTTSDKDDLLELNSERATESDELNSECASESDELNSEQATKSDANELIIHSPTASGPNKKIFSFASCSSSVSSNDSMLEDPFQDSDNEQPRSSFDLDANDQLATNHDDSLEPTPPIQAMERSTTQKYRIPSSVFARKNTTNPEWGMASNESLFSIQMGGKSFCNQDSFFWKSGELNLGFGSEPSMSGHLTNFKAPEVGTIPELDSNDENHELDDNEISSDCGSSGSDEPVKPVFRDNQEDQGHKSVVEGRTSQVSVESGGSTKSFAFPILTEHNSTSTHGSVKSKSEAQLEMLPESQPEQENQPKADTPATTSTWSKWFLCFRCCTCCS